MSSSCIYLSSYNIIIAENTLVTFGRAVISSVEVKVYCSCRMPYDSNSDSMIQCDICKGWYHFECVGIVNTENYMNVKWSCAE